MDDILREGVECECGRLIAGGSKCFDCEEKRVAAKKVAVASLGGLLPYENYTLEAFVPSVTNMPVFNAVKAFDKGSDNFYLCGPVGSGKSHLAAIAARKYIGRFRVRTVKPSDISSRVRSASDAREELSVIQDIAGASVLVLDDLGTCKQTEFLVGLIYTVIDIRYRNKCGGLICTSNLSLSELATAMGEDRICSRLAEMCGRNIFSLRGERDHRMMCG
jgi:DNA replication protein DnaC